MAVYEYSCRCGARPTRFAAMGAAPRRIRCPVCRRYALRRFSAPSLRTETVLSDKTRRSFAAAGYTVESWRDVKRVEREEQVGLTNRHDDDWTDRRLGSLQRQLNDDIQARIDQANRIEVHTKKRRRKAKIA